MVGTISKSFSLTFWKLENLKSDFQKVRILNGRISDSTVFDFLFCIRSKIESTFCFQRSDSPSSLSNGNSDGVSAPDSPTFLGGRRAMSVMNVASTGGSLSREKNATGGSGSSKGTTVSASGLPRYNTEFGFNTGWAFFLPSKTLVCFVCLFVVSVIVYLFSS